MAKSKHNKKTGTINEEDLGPVLYLIHCQSSSDPTKPYADVTIDVESDNGNWSSVTNACGDVLDPGRKIAGVTLARGQYVARFYDKKGNQFLRDGTLEPLIWDLAWPPDEPILVGLSPQAYVPIDPGELPDIPTRAQVCSIQHSLQGLMYETAAYGPVPAWFYAKLSPEDRATARRNHRDIGDTHICIPVSEAYRESGTLWPEELKDGYDFTQDLDSWRAVIHEVVSDGFFVDAPLAGDGLGAGPGYNDPVGRTYGHEWLMANLERMLVSLQGDGTDARPDLTPYVIFRPGWDAVFYGWGGDGATTSQYGLRWRHVWRFWQARVPRPTPTQQQLDSQQQRVKNFGDLFRKILPQGYLSIEHTPGNIPVGLGPGDYAPGGLMTTYDTIMGEFNTVHEDSFWQVIGRCIDPYHRPPDQPAGDDPNPPKYLPGQNTPRGPYFYVAFEPTKGGVYEWCRGNCTLAQVQEVDKYMRDCGCTLTGYSGLIKR